MNQSISSEKIHENDAEDHQRHRGFIVFSEKKLRYEKGVKAWIFLGPYLLGALGLEGIMGFGQAKTVSGLGAVIGFLAYLVLFPPAWQRILKLVAAKKAVPLRQTAASAMKLQ